MARAYDAPARRERRLRTRVAIRTAAERLFVERGYAGTSITAIARDAGVAVQTVYDSFGTKRELLRAAARGAAIGSDATAMFDAPWLERVADEPDQLRRWERLREATAEVITRTLPMATVVRAAARSDPAIRVLWDELEEERRDDVALVVDLLADAGPLRVPRVEAIDLMWALSRSTDLYAALAVDRGWPADEAFAAVSDAIARAVLPQPR